MVDYEFLTFVVWGGQILMLCVELYVLIEGEFEV